MDCLKRLCPFVGLILLLTGCCPIALPQEAPYRVITQVDVVYKNGDVQLHRQFFREQSIRQILDYLRFADPYGTPRENPEELTHRLYEITLTYSDGFRRRYEQRADRYFRIGDGPWKCIDSQRAMYLGGLLGMMDSESPQTESP